MINTTRTILTDEAPLIVGTSLEAINRSLLLEVYLEISRSNGSTKKLKVQWADLDG